MRATNTNIYKYANIYKIWTIFKYITNTGPRAIQFEFEMQQLDTMVLYTTFPISQVYHQYNMRSCQIRRALAGLQGPSTAPLLQSCILYIYNVKLNIPRCTATWASWQIRTQYTKHTTQCTTFGTTFTTTNGTLVHIHIVVQIHNLHTKTKTYFDHILYSVTVCTIFCYNIYMYN